MQCAAARAMGGQSTAGASFISPHSVPALLEGYVTGRFRLPRFSVLDERQQCRIVARGRRQALVGARRELLRQGRQPIRETPVPELSPSNSPAVRTPTVDHTCRGEGDGSAGS